jgi:eukaryotic translation initiation factor 2C
MLKVPSARLPFPPVFYRLTSGKVSPNPKRGSGWNLTDDESFYSVKASSLRYVLLHTLDPSEITSAMASFDRDLKFQMTNRLGMNSNHVTLINNGGSKVTGPDSLRTWLQRAKNARANLVVLMLKQPNRSNYSEFKTMTDCEFGLPSICLAKPKVFQGQEDRKYMTNIAQKINIKLGGYNGQVEGVAKSLSKDTLVLGADVVHPGHGAILDAPSIACIVGSVDHEGGRFLGSARLQSKDKKDREIIDHVQEMVVERIRAWKDGTGSTMPPANIIYYRDGVSEGQYRQVRDIELKAIEAAHRTFAPGGKTLNIPGKNSQGGVKITAIVGVKRHHTRFYPIFDKDKDKFGNKNCLPGTWVDRAVTSPYYNDFYLQSHSGIKGTARPTHYFILRNDGINSCKSTDELRQLVSALPHTDKTHHQTHLYLDTPAMLHLLPRHHGRLLRNPNLLRGPPVRPRPPLPAQHLVRRRRRVSHQARQCKGESSRESTEGSRCAVQEW